MNISMKSSMSFVGAELFAAALICASACDSTSEQPSDCASVDGDGNATLCQPDTGFQLATPVFDVPQGVEVQDCYFFRVPADEMSYVNRIEVNQNSGTHHMNVFRVTSQEGNPLAQNADDGTVVLGTDEGAECWKSGNWSDWPLAINSQQSTGDAGGHFEWSLPTTADGKQVVQAFEPGELLMLQTHYVNATTQATNTGKGKVSVNFYAIDEELAGPTVQTLFATHQNIEVKPGDVEKSFIAGCNLGNDSPAVTVIGANSHFHSRGVRFTIAPADEQGDPLKPFYTNTSWDEPVMAREDVLAELPAGGSISYECTYTYPVECGDTCQPLDTPVEEITCGNGAQCLNFEFQPACANSFCFGPKVETMEHCNIFVYFYTDEPSGSFDVNCF